MHRLVSLLARVGVAAWLAGGLAAACGDGASAPAPDPAPDGRPPSTDPAVIRRQDRLHAVATWLYQLQGPEAAEGRLDLGALAAHPAGLYVIDYSATGTQQEEFTAADLAPLRAQGLVLAYLSIGEAERVRFYWDADWVVAGAPGPTAPAWLGPPNPDWPDNFTVRYWDPDWQTIILGPGGYLDRIVAAGYDGVYLDRVDAWETWETLPDAGPPVEGPLMAEWVEALAAAARARAGEAFLVVVQNAPAILNALTVNAQDAYFAAIDGLAVEDTFYFGGREEDNPLNVQTEALRWITQFQIVGKPVFAVDYLLHPVTQRDFARRARAEGWVPLVAPRALDRVLLQP